MGYHDGIIGSPMGEHFSICQLRDTTPSAFIDFWAPRYGDDLEPLYDANIAVKPFTDNTIMALFEWKNGSKLSAKKRNSVEQNYISRKDHEWVKRAIEFPRGSQLDETRMFASQFLNEFPEGGEIWRIFWLHCCNQQFPIYDQHVHRAMVFVEEGHIEELDKFADRKIDLYLQKYLPFHRRFSGDQRQIDRALHTFGRFLQMWPDLRPAADGS
jgi:hypothetical protein